MYIISDFLFKILSAFYGNFQFFHIFLYRRSRFFPVFVYHIHHDASCGNSISHFFHLLKFFRMMTIKSHHDGRICRFPNNGDDICQISFYICFPIADSTEDTMYTNPVAFSTFWQIRFSDAGPIICMISIPYVSAKGRISICSS